MKREKKLTKRERKAEAGGPGPSGSAKPGQDQQHIHCVACGRHIDPSEFGVPIRAKMLRCQHGAPHASCVECEERSRALLAEHDRTGNPVQSAGAWH